MKKIKSLDLLITLLKSNEAIYKIDTVGSYIRINTEEINNMTFSEVINLITEEMLFKEIYFENEL